MKVKLILPGLQDGIASNRCNFQWVTHGHYKTAHFFKSSRAA